MASYADDERDGSIIYDQHTLNVSYDDNLTERDINSCFNKVCTDIRRKFGPSYKTDFKLNFLRRFNQETRERESTGISYIFITNPKVYHILLGRNADGTDRVRMVPDPEWTPPETEVKKDEPLTFENMSFGSMNWADMCETVEAKAPLIRIEEPPLVDSLMCKCKDQEYPITVRASFIRIDDDMLQYDTNKLTGFVHEDVTDKVLKSSFASFSLHEGFPAVESKKIQKGKSRLVFIKFKPSTHDAMFARQLMRFSTFKIAGKEFTAKFDYPLTRENV